MDFVKVTCFNIACYVNEDNVILISCSNLKSRQITAENVVEKCDKPVCCWEYGMTRKIPQGPAMLGCRSCVI